MTDTKHLDTAINILKGSKAAKRARPRATYVLNHVAGAGYSILQGPRGKVLNTFYGTPKQTERAARRAIPVQATMEVVGP